MKLALTLAAAACALAACAPDYPEPAPFAPAYGADAVAAAPGSLCFRTSDMRNHTVGDDSTMYVDIGQRGVYRFEMSGSCLAGASASDPLVIRAVAGSSLICRPIDLDISISRGGLNSPCIVRDFSRMSPEAVAALPPRLRP